MDAPRHTTVATLAPIDGVTITYEPETYGVTSWIARDNVTGAIIARSPWEKLTHKMVKGLRQ